MPFGPFKKPLVTAPVPACPELTLGGQPLLTPQMQRGNLGLVGPALPVERTMAELLGELDSKLVPIYLLGRQQEDAGFLSLALTLPLNAVRTVPMPVQPGMEAAAVRDLLEEIALSSHRHAFVGQPAYLFVGRNLGPHWLSVLGRAASFRANRVVVVADVSLQLKTRLQTLFSNFLVWPDERRIVDRSLDSLHRYDQPKPVYDTRWTSVGATLVSRR